jgi:2-dehydro-3-deoxyphosphooctonate aldolase (KDO 8-P synthase)
VVNVKEVKIGTIKFNNKKNFVLIAGLNVLEDEIIIKEVVEECKLVTEELEIPFIFKASYDKANRSSIDSFRGPGIDKGLDILKKIKLDYKVPVISDVHSPEEISKACKVLDLLQIPAFLCRQTDLITSAASNTFVFDMGLFRTYCFTFQRI